MKTVTFEAARDKAVDCMIRANDATTAAKKQALALEGAGWAQLALVLEER